MFGIMCHKGGESMIKIAIVDDELNILKDLYQNIYNEFINRNLSVDISTYLKGEDLFRAIKENHMFDIVFLDIELPDGLGLDVAKRLRDMYNNIIISFVTSFDNYVYDAFDYDVIGYIRKQELSSRLGTVVDRMIKRYKEISNEKIFKNSSHQIRTTTQNIIYFESDDHNIKVFLNDGSTFSYTYSLKKLEEEYSIHGFFRIHAGYLVNLRYVFSIEKNMVYLKVNELIIPLPVSRVRSKALKTAYQQLFRGGI